MKEQLIEAYAAILESERAVTFEHSNNIYRIWANDEGWYLELLEENSELWNSELTATEESWTEFDGGLCTGSARDAVEFMLPTGGE